MGIAVTPEIQAKLDEQRKKYWLRREGKLKGYVCRHCHHRLEATERPKSCPECGKVSK